MSRLATAGRILLLAAAATGAALVAAEIGLRFLWPQALLHDPDAFVPDPVLGARLKTGFTDQVVTPEFTSRWIVNADGYRGARAGERGPSAHRIVALGDSFTFGYGVEAEQAWPWVVETRLNEGRAEDDRFEVLNLGVGGYGTWQEALWLERMAGKLHPDLALVALYVGNDPADNARTVPDSEARDDPAVRADGRRTRSEDLKRWLGSHLHLYELAASRADELLVRIGLRQLLYPFEMEILLPHEPPDVSQAWRSTQVALTRLAAFSRKSSLPVSVVIIPMKHQVSDRVWRRVLSHYGAPADADVYDRDRPQRILSAMLETVGLPEIDLLAGMREAARTEPDGAVFYWPRDQHWSARGHDEAARIIAREVARRNPPRAR